MYLCLSTEWVRKRISEWESELVLVSKSKKAFLKKTPNQPSGAIDLSIFDWFHNNSVGDFFL